MRYTDPSGHFFSEIGNAISGAIGAIGDAIGSAVGAIGDAISSVGDAISGLGDSLGEVPGVGSVLEGAAKIAGGAIKTVGGIVSGNPSAISSGVTSIAEGVGGILYTYAKDIAAAVIGNASHLFTIPRDIYNVGKKLFNGDLIGAGKAVGKTVYNIGVPRYGLFNGSGYGINTTPNSKPIDELDEAGLWHDITPYEPDWVQDALKVRGLGLYGNAYRALGAIGFSLGHHLGSDKGQDPRGR